MVCAMVLVAVTIGVATACTWFDQVLVWFTVIGLNAHSELYWGPLLDMPLFNMGFKSFSSHEKAVCLSYCQPCFCSVMVYLHIQSGKSWLLWASRLSRQLQPALSKKSPMLYCASLTHGWVNLLSVSIVFIICPCPFCSSRSYVVRAEPV